MNATIEAIAKRVEALPPSIRPAAYGPFILISMMIQRGAAILVPVLIVLTFLRSPAPVRTLAQVGGVVLFALLGSAVSGLAYGFIGRPLRAAFPAGRYLAGIVTIVPYMIVVTIIVQLTTKDPLPLKAALFVGAALSVLFGLVIGHSWFAPHAAAETDDHRPAS